MGILRCKLDISILGIIHGNNRAIAWATVVDWVVFIDFCGRTFPTKFCHEVAGLSLFMNN
jgi:hypothetical protein